MTSGAAVDTDEDCRVHGKKTLTPLLVLEPRGKYTVSHPHLRGGANLSSLTSRQGSSVGDECFPGNVNCWNVVKTSQCVTRAIRSSFQQGISLCSEIRENLHAASTASKNCTPRKSSLFKTPVGWCNELFRTYPSLFIAEHFKQLHTFPKKKKKHSLLINHPYFVHWVFLSCFAIFICAEPIMRALLFGLFSVSLFLNMELTYPCSFPLECLRCIAIFSQSFIIKIRCTVQVKWSNALKSVATCHKSSFEEVRTVIAYSWHRFYWKKNTFSIFCWFTRYEGFGIALLFISEFSISYISIFIWILLLVHFLCSLTEISRFFSFHFVISNYM